MCIGLEPKTFSFWFLYKGIASLTSLIRPFYVRRYIGSYLFYIMSRGGSWHPFLSLFNSLYLYLVYRLKESVSSLGFLFWQKLSQRRFQVEYFFSWWRKEENLKKAVRNLNRIVYVKLSGWRYCLKLRVSCKKLPKPCIYSISLYLTYIAFS